MLRRAVLVAVLALLISMVFPALVIQTASAEPETNGWPLAMNGEVRPHVMPDGDVVAIACPPSAEGARLAYATAAGEVRWGIAETETPRPQCLQPVVGDASGSVYFATSDDAGNYLESRTSAGSLRWRSDPFGGGFQQHLVLGFDGGIYVLVFDGVRSHVRGFSSSEGKATVDVALEGISYGLYPNADGLGVATLSGVSYYSYRGELQRHVDRPAELAGVDTTAGGADGRVFLAGYSDSCARFAIARISPTGLDWVWQRESSNKCSHPGLAATPNGGAILNWDNVSNVDGERTTFISINGSGAKTWTHLPTLPAGSTDNANYWTPPVVDTEGRVMLASNYSYPCSFSSGRCEATQVDFVTQNSEEPWRKPLVVTDTEQGGQNVTGMAVSGDQLYLGAFHAQLLTRDSSLGAYDMAGEPTDPPSEVFGEITPSTGRPGQVFNVNASCSDGSKPVFRMQSGDDEPLGHFAVLSPPTEDNGSYTETIQVGEDGKYQVNVSCATSKPLDLPFSVVAAPYVALGDSYSSGEGGSNYEPSTATESNRCHRSSASAGWTLSVEQKSGMTRDFAACSGSLISAFYERWSTIVNPEDIEAPSNALEIPQLQHVSRQSPGTTKLVTLTIGGNDVGFPSVLSSCIYLAGSSIKNHFGGYGCAKRDQALLKIAFGWLRNGRPAGCYVLPGIDPQTGNQPITCSAKGVPALHDLYKQIARKLPSGSQVVVAGYPHLFGRKFSRDILSPSGRSCRVGSLFNGAFIGSDDIDWLNNQAAILNATIASEVRIAQRDLETQTDSAGKGVAIKFAPLEPNGDVSAIDRFKTHRICDTSEPWFHGLEFSGLSVRQESFHPSENGQRAYAAAVVPKL